MPCEYGSKICTPKRLCEGCAKDAVATATEKAHDRFLKRYIESLYEGSCSCHISARVHFV